MGLGRAAKGPSGPFSAFQGPGKTGQALKGFPKGWEGIPAGVDGIWRHLEALWGHLGGPAIWAGHLGHLGHVRVSRNSLDLVWRNYPPKNRQGGAPQESQKILKKNGKS